MNNKVLPLLPGETPMPKAPAVVLDDGTNCIPQHYLSYQHSLQSVSDIVAQINFDPKYVLFVDQDNASIFIQVGIIGKDNYQSLASQVAEKIVYGRRWRVEPQLPSSEIIQTAFLALLKAREHEVRELFKYERDCGNSYQKSVTTPFSCHHDLPLIAMSKLTNTNAVQEKTTRKQLIEHLNAIKYDGCTFNLNLVSPLSEDKFLITVNLEIGLNTKLPELLQQKNKEWAFIVDELTVDRVLYALMDQALHHSNRYVEEHFTFKEYARFSRQQSINKISELSTRTRVLKASDKNNDFAHTFASNNYETDLSRVPKIGTGKLADKIKSQLEKYDIQYGILPKHAQE